MRKLEDGSTLVIRRAAGIGYFVEHIATNGIVADTFDCDNLAEARAAFAMGPSRW